MPAFVFINVNTIDSNQTLNTKCHPSIKTQRKTKIIIELTDYGQQMWQILFKTLTGMDAILKIYLTAHRDKTSGMGLGLVMVIITD